MDKKRLKEVIKVKKNIKKCNACGVLLKDNEKECPVCGYFNEDLTFEDSEEENKALVDSEMEIDNDNNEDNYTCNNCNAAIIKGALVCPKCHAIFVDSPIFVEAQEKGYILKEELDDILSKIKLSKKDYNSIIEAFVEEDIEIKDDEDNDESYECNNCGCKVSESDDYCPNCGLYFDNDLSIDFIQEMKEYLIDQYDKYYVKEQTGFVGIKATKRSRYYLLYFSEKEGKTSLFYRVNSMSEKKFVLDVTDKSLKEVKTIVNIIMSFYKENILDFYIRDTYR